MSAPRGPHSVELRSSKDHASAKRTRLRSDAVFTPGPESALQAYRFEQFLNGLGDCLRDVSVPLRIGLCCLAYEGVCSLHDYEGLLHSLKNAHPVPTGKRVSWPHIENRPSGRQARLLSARTILALSQLDGAIDPATAVDLVSTWLSKNYQDLDISPVRSPLEQTLSDASAWLYTLLPGALYAYVRGEIAIAHLPERIIARILSPNVETEVSEVVLDRGVTDQLSEDVLLPVDEIAMEVLLTPHEKYRRSHPNRTIATLKELCSLPRGVSTIRVSDHVARAQVQQKLANTAELHHDEGHASAVLVAWVMYLFSTGSLKRSNPAISTVAAYITSLIEHLAAELAQLEDPLAALNQRQWRQFMESLGRHGGGQSFGPALATFHLWALDTYGFDPLPDIIFNKVDDIDVHANLVWPHERQALLAEASSVSIDRRVNEQVEVMAALGIAGLFRIGDLPSLQISHIVFVTAGLKIYIDPSLKWHKGKGAGARRALLIEAGYACEVIKAWVERRRKEEFGADGLLFGDPNQKERTYRFAHCTQLLNRLLKKVTADDSVSFHTLRHTGATERAVAIVYDSKNSLAISRLDELQSMMGHQSAYTLWASYFHLPEYVVRRCLDRLPCVFTMGDTEAAFWLSESEAALRKAKSRAMQVIEATTTSSYFYGRVQDASRTGPNWLHIPDRPCILTVQAMATPLSHHVEFRLEWVVLALRNISTTPDTAVICSRMSCLPSHLQQLSHAAAKVARNLDPLAARKIGGGLLAGAEPDVCVQWVRRAASAHNLDFEFKKAPYVLNIMKSVVLRANSEMTRDATQAWLVCKRSEVLSLDDLQTVGPFVRLLLESRVPASCLIARLQMSDSDLATRRRHVDNFAMDWVNTVGSAVHVQSVQVFRGHPKNYLVVARKPPQAGTAIAPASTRMRELHGLFFCLAVLQHLNV